MLTLVDLHAELNSLTGSIYDHTDKMLMVIENALLSESFRDKQSALVELYTLLGGDYADFCDYPE